MQKAATASDTKTTSTAAATGHQLLCAARRGADLAAPRVAPMGRPLGAEMLGPPVDAPGDTAGEGDVLADAPARVPAPPRLPVLSEAPALLAGLDVGVGDVDPGVSPGRGTVGSPGPEPAGGTVGTVGDDTGPAAAASDVPPTTRTIAHT